MKKYLIVEIASVPTTVAREPNVTLRLVADEDTYAAAQRRVKSLPDGEYFILDNKGPVTKKTERVEKVLIDFAPTTKRPRGSKKEKTTEKPPQLTTDAVNVAKKAFGIK